VDRMSELERVLEALGRETAFPPAPDFRPRVRAVLVEEAVRRGATARPYGTRRTRRALALAVALTLLLAATVLASSAAREAVRDLLGLEGVTIQRAPQEPPAITGEELRLGERVSLDDASKELGFEPLIPAALGPPDATYVRGGPQGGELSLAYEPRPGLPSVRATGLGLLVSEFRGDLEPEFLGKVLGPDSRARRIRVDGAPAIWIAGAPHTLLYRSESGKPRETRVRAARRVLLLERGRLLIRFESGLDRLETVEIARSLEQVGNQ
jgi:hypothetical protein